MYLMKEGGIVSSLDPASGQILKQGRTPDALEEYFASPVAADGKVFLVSASGKVTVLKADAQWEILAMNDLDEEVLGHTCHCGRQSLHPYTECVVLVRCEREVNKQKANLHSACCRKSYNGCRPS